MQALHACPDFKYPLYLYVFIELLQGYPGAVYAYQLWRGVNATGMSLKPWILLERMYTGSPVDSMLAK